MRVRDVMAQMERMYPAALQESWDSNGLIVGEPDQTVESILLAVDPVPQTVEQAVEGNYDMLITHHPLYLRGTNSVSCTDYKGRIVHELIRANVSLMNAHTNADAAARGVAWSLAHALGFEGTPFEPQESKKTTQLVGLGRYADLDEETTLGEFAARVARALPAGPHGIYVGAPYGADGSMPVKRVAVSGGAGDSFLQKVRELGADVYVTADLRHHPASEHLSEGGPALISGSHWATEWLWLPNLQDDLQAALPGVQVDVSRTCTEPWQEHKKTLG
ncbi:Nif3-like dinuclear metal center hexameric protein [Gleimia hominis]|uniref:Nif3-like dinuclear metal center hexameric protein n=1 Tax=Gleimia hominis TaxID=595468 RepID=UPI0025428B75|nr:Nif3-like dinuclear metal center hexameric protein [Gleimia hominis]WIK65288.1 Nif3-like dinuclear metal center hexameric protein [Gleimia hominis]